MVLTAESSSMINPVWLNIDQIVLWSVKILGCFKKLMLRNALKLSEGIQKSGNDTPGH